MVKLDTANTSNLTQTPNSINSAGKSIEKQSALGRFFAKFEELPFIGRLFQVIKIICETLSNWMHSTKAVKELPPPTALKGLLSPTASTDTLKQTHSGEDQKKSEVLSETARPIIEQIPEVDISTITDPSDEAKRQALLAQFESKGTRRDAAVSATDLRPISSQRIMRFGSLTNIKLNIPDRPSTEQVSEVDISTIADQSDEVRRQALLAQFESSETGLDAAVSVTDPIPNQEEVLAEADDLILPEQTATDQEVKASPKPGKPVLKAAPTNKYSSDVVTTTQRKLRWDPEVKSPLKKEKTSTGSSSSVKPSSRPDAAEVVKASQEFQAKKEQPNLGRLRAQRFKAAQVIKPVESVTPEVPVTSIEIAVNSTESSSSVKPSSRPDAAGVVRASQEFQAKKERPSPGRLRAQRLKAAQVTKQVEPVNPEEPVTPEVPVTSIEIAVTSTESSSSVKPSSRPDAAEVVQASQEFKAKKERSNPGRLRAQGFKAAQIAKSVGSVTPT